MVNPFNCLKQSNGEAKKAIECCWWVVRTPSAKYGNARYGKYFKYEHGEPGRLTIRFKWRVEIQKKNEAH